MRSRTDNSRSTTSNDTLGVPQQRAAEDELKLGCDVCHGSCAVKETLLFWRISGPQQFAVAHLDCALPPVRVPS